MLSVLFARTGWTKGELTENKAVIVITNKCEQYSYSFMVISSSVAPESEFARNIDRYQV